MAALCRVENQRDIVVLQPVNDVRAAFPDLVDLRRGNALGGQPRGSAFGGVKGRSELPHIVERYLAGEFKLDDFITHTMALEQINEAFDLMHRGESIRSVIHFDHQ